MASTDWTGVSTNFVNPETTPEQRALWKAAWDGALDTLVELASPGEREKVRALLARGVQFDEPRGWAREIEQQFKQGIGQARPTKERLKAVADRFHRAVAAIRTEAERDPNYFPSPVGQELMRIFSEAMLHLVGTTGGRSVGPALNAVVWPTLKIVLQNPEILTVDTVARQYGTISFERWANRFRATVKEIVEGWYRPLVSAFYRLSRMPKDGQIPDDVAELGTLLGRARDHWSPASPLQLLADPRITVVRNSEAHSNSTLDLATERFIFISRTASGIEKARWCPTADQFQHFAVHVVHLGEVMRAVLTTVPLRSLGPELLLDVPSRLLASPTSPGGAASAA